MLITPLRFSLLEFTRRKDSRGLDGTRSEKTSALKTAGQIFSPIWFLSTSREFVNSKGNSRLKVNILSFIALIYKIL